MTTDQKKTTKSAKTNTESRPNIAALADMLNSAAAGSTAPDPRKDARREPDLSTIKYKLDNACALIQLFEEDLLDGIDEIKNSGPVAKYFCQRIQNVTFRALLAADDAINEAAAQLQDI